MIYLNIHTCVVRIIDTMNDAVLAYYATALQLFNGHKNQLIYT